MKLSEARWLVIDCETSGLDAARDRLLSIGAVAVRGERIALGESHAALVRQAAPSTPENILVHGIGGDAQLAGSPQEQAVGELEALLGASTPVGFHAAFDARVLQRAGLKRRRWLDLEPLARSLFPEAGPLHSLDEWLQRFGIEHPGRHDALFDAMASAELFLLLLSAARRQGAATVADVLAAAGSRRWLGGS